VPEGYFEDLPNAILERVKQSETKKRAMPARSRRIYWLSTAIAAVISGMILLFFLLRPSQEETDFGDLALILEDKEAILNYLINDADVDEETILASLSGEMCDELSVIPQDSIRPASDTASIKEHQEFKFQMDSSISADDILQYLMDEGVEVAPTY
jgi:hypothetical protein